MNKEIKKSKNDFEVIDDDKEEKNKKKPLEERIIDPTREMLSEIFTEPESVNNEFLQPVVNKLLRGIDLNTREEAVFKALESKIELFDIFRLYLVLWV